MIVHALASRAAIYTACDSYFRACVRRVAWRWLSCPRSDGRLVDTCNSLMVRGMTSMHAGSLVLAHALRAQVLHARSF